jgi:hypothetical protein
MRKKPLSLFYLDLNLDPDKSHGSTTLLVRQNCLQYVEEEYAHLHSERVQVGHTVLLSLEDDGVGHERDSATNSVSTSHIKIRAADQDPVEIWTRPFNGHCCDRGYSSLLIYANI